MMRSALRGVAHARRTSLVGGCLALVIATQLIGAGKAPIKVLKYDPAAEKQELFAALESGDLSVRVVAHDVHGGNLFLENKSGKPLTVDLPDAVAMVHVLKQVGALNNAGFFGQQQNGFANGNQSGALGQQQGQSGGGQSIGGMFGQQQGNTPGIGNAQNGNAQNVPGNGLFSIPPDRVAQVAYQSVCLDYGKPDPSPRMTYKPVRVEDFTDDKVLQEMLFAYGKGRIDQTAAQAAAWHLRDKMGWSKLASLKEYTLPGVYTSQVPTFPKAKLQAAQELVTLATKRAEDRMKSEPLNKPETGPARSGAIALKADR